MSIKAIAFHESVALDKTHEYFESPEARFQGETQAGKCVKCSLAFAIVLLVKSDPRNLEYVGHLNAIIGEDCIGGLHKDEYVLDESEGN